MLSRIKRGDFSSVNVRTLATAYESLRVSLHSHHDTLIHLIPNFSFFFQKAFGKSIQRKPGLTYYKYIISSIIWIATRKPFLKTRIFHWHAYKSGNKSMRSPPLHFSLCMMTRIKFRKSTTNGDWDCLPRKYHWQGFKELDKVICFTSTSRNQWHLHHSIHSMFRSIQP